MWVLRFDQYDKIIEIYIDYINNRVLISHSHMCMIVEQQFPFQPLFFLAFVNCMSGQSCAVISETSSSAERQLFG